MVTLFTVVASSALLVANVCFPVFAQQQREQQQNLTLTLSEVTSCPDYRNMPNRLDNIRLRVDPKDGDLYVNSDVTIQELLKDPTALRVDFYKCVTKVEQSCQLYKTIKRSTICEDIGKENVVWTSILDSIQGFEDSCPVRPGLYKMVDAPLTKAIRDNVALIKGHWRVTTLLLKGGQVIACQKGYGEVKQKRRSQNKNNPKEEIEGNDKNNAKEDIEGYE